MASTDFQDRIDFDARAERQARDADSGSRVPSGVAEHGDEKVGCAIDDLRMIDEFWRRGDKARQPQDLHNAFEIAESGFRLCQQAERGLPGGFLPVLDGYAYPSLPASTRQAASLATCPEMKSWSPEMRKGT